MPDTQRVQTGSKNGAIEDDGISSSPVGFQKTEGEIENEGDRRPQHKFLKNNFIYPRNTKN